MIIFSISLIFSQFPGYSSNYYLRLRKAADLHTIALQANYDYCLLDHITLILLVDVGRMATKFNLTLNRRCVTAMKR